LKTCLHEPTHDRLFVDPQSDPLRPCLDPYVCWLARKAKHGAPHQPQSTALVWPDWVLNIWLRYLTRLNVLYRLQGRMRIAGGTFKGGRGLELGNPQLPRAQILPICRYSHLESESSSRKVDSTHERTRSISAARSFHHCRCRAGKCLYSGANLIAVLQLQYTEGTMISGFSLRKIHLARNSIEQMNWRTALTGTKTFEHAPQAQSLKTTPAAASATSSANPNHFFSVNDEKGLLLTCIAPKIDTNPDTDVFKSCALAPGRNLDDGMRTSVQGIHYEQSQHQKEREEWQ